MTYEVEWGYSYYDMPRVTIPCSEEEARARSADDHSVQLMRREVIGGVEMGWAEVDEVERPS